jgi:hypothetical protein
MNLFRQKNAVDLLNFHRGQIASLPPKRLGQIRVRKGMVSIGLVQFTHLGETCLLGIG